MLVSPQTLEPLHVEVTEASGDEVLQGTLTDGDRASYPIRGGIPDFVPPEVAKTQTVRSFAQKWSKHKSYRDHTGRFYTDWYLQRYGFCETKRLREFLCGMEFLLDAGTGAGRDAANFAEHSTATVFAVDTSRAALEVARQQVNNARVVFLQADLNRLPLPDEFFDFISCDQVIHHTPDPRAAFENLSRKLKAGGQICCYVYKKKAVIREFTDDYIREQIRELPIDDALRVCESITHLSRQLAGLHVTLEVDRDIPILGIRKGKIDLQRFFHWNLFKCFWNDEFDFFTNNIINFDWYHPEYCHRLEPSEFREWFAHGWQMQAWDVQDAGISCRAKKV
jgi:ubiquinone/menaquinone biosynthesis C-methylase UbiE